ncbi:hypothetical protein CDAR_506021 [Caerostris darwini]|uniref:Uncharacterized protein n=1 Tax=Caerostris darwini TaxID=1538125 RepID=A0AAV4WIJ3_9ARAC|nr:hypothetical protein CDAR_506021 [Caerostris darwini]
MAYVLKVWIGLKSKEVPRNTVFNNATQTDVLAYVHKNVCDYGVFRSGRYCAGSHNRDEPPSWNIQVRIEYPIKKQTCAVISALVISCSMQLILPDEFLTLFITKRPS